MKIVNKIRTWYRKRKEYYHVQAGLRGILLGWGFCMILLITGFALAAFQIAAREARREKNSAYETMVSYVTGEIEKKCALLSGLAEEAAEIPRENREELVQAFEGRDGLAVWGGYIRRRRKTLWSPVPWRFPWIPPVNFTYIVRTATWYILRDT